MTVKIPRRILIAQEIRALRSLSRAVGGWEALRIGVEIRKASGRGQPWAGRPDAVSEAEVWSRQQVAGAILLYQTLLTRAYPNALALTREIVVSAAIPWMKWAIGTLSREHYEGLDDAEREAWFRARSLAFGNMTVGAVEAGRRGMTFQVTACHFPSLCDLADVPELAPVFCAVDAFYFGGVQRDVDLDRAETIAGGDSRCTFRFRWKP